MTAKIQVQYSFKRMCELYKLNTIAKRNLDKNSKDFYLEDFWKLDYNSIYGGFEEIFALRYDAIIYSGQNKITKDYGNWQDINIGSMIKPCMFSSTSIL